jgi:hypothetical protein
MFVGTEARMNVSFAVASARLGDLAARGRLGSLSGDTYGKEIQVGPVPGVSRLVAVKFRKLATHGDSAVLALRWEAAGPGGMLFPAFDADITLSPAGEDGTSLALMGVYRPPLGAVGSALDRAVFRRVATATVRDFARRVAEEITGPDCPVGVRLR